MRLRAILPLVLCLLVIPVVASASDSLSVETLTALPGVTVDQTPPPPVVTATQSFGFDYKDADLASAAVVRFEMQVDTGAFASIAIPPKANDAQTPAGSSTYKTPIPALVTGSHSVTFRACNTALCSDASTPFPFVLAVKPPTTTGTRVLGS